MSALIAALIVLSALAVLQLLLAFGVPWGRVAWGGAHRVLPRRQRVGSCAAVILYGGFAALLLSRTGTLPAGDHPFVVIMTWVLLAYFVLSIVANAMSSSTAERWTMVPACIVLAAATLIIAIG